MTMQINKNNIFYVIVIVKIILAILFVLCLLDMPYSYYILVRFAGMVCFAWLAWLEKEKVSNNFFFVFWIASAILINPIFKLNLGRFIWNIVDIIWSIVLLLSIKRDYSLSNNFSLIK
jgi:hypothetical protein